MALTDAGQRLLENAGPAVEQALESLKTVSARPGEVTGRVRLSVPTAAVPLILTRLLPAFAERHPEVEVEVFAENRFVNMVAEGLDAGIRLSEAIACTGPCRSRIPEQADHRFRRMPIGDSGGRRSPIPEQADR